MPYLGKQPSEVSSVAVDTTTGTFSGEVAAASLDISGNVDVDGVLETDALSIASTTITSTAAELNIMDGVTATAAELNIMDGVTSTTAELNILDGVTSTAAELNILDGVTSTAAELNLLDGVSGLVQADLTKLAAVDSTAAELNILDGVTSTAAELNLLDGVTSTTAELNILDGVTSTAAELNILDGVTSTTAELNALDGITAVVGELNALDIGSTAVGTAVASKAVILDSSKDYTGIRNLTITGELDAATLDISGDIDVDGTTNLDVVDIDGAVDMASTLGVTGKITADAGIDIDNINIDGTTIALSSGDLTLDAAGDIILDADGADIRLRDGGTEFAVLINDSSNLNIQSVIQDKDIKFTGNDGGSGITALTLDMSNAGAASFSGNIFVPDNKVVSLGAGGDIALSSNGTNGTIAAPNGNLTADVAGDIVLDAGGSSVVIQDDGTGIGRLRNVSSDFIIKSEVSDKDLIFKGNDGGAEITAFRLDMSDSGRAIFNSRASINGGTNDGILSIAANTTAMDTNTNHQICLQNTSQTTSAKGLINYKTAADSGAGFVPVAFGGRTVNPANATRTGAFVVFVADADNVDIGNDERFRIAANGDITATDTSIASNSDSRLKKDITDYTYDIEKFKKYEPKTFEWKNKEAHGNKENNRGFLAQDVKNVDDRWIEEIEVNKENLDFDIIPDNISLTSKLGEKDAMYISVIQQLIARIETLENA